MKEHILIGVVILIILYIINQKFGWLVIPDNKLFLIQLGVIGVVYSLMPDIDQPGSIINRYVTLVLVGVVVYSFYKNMPKYGIIAVAILGLLKIITHRTLIHSVMGGMIIALPLLYLGVIYFVVGVLAFTIHIIADGDFNLAFEKDWW